MFRIFKILIKTIILIMVTYMMFVPVLKAVNRNFLVEVIAIQDTIDIARENAYEIELTGVTQITLEYNKELARKKYYSNFDILKPFYPQEIRDIKLISRAEKSALFYIQIHKYG